MVNQSAPLTSVNVTPILQTILPQNIQLTTTPHTFLLTTPAQQALPVSTSLSNSPIIIHAITPDTMETSENVMQMNAPLIINNSNTSLASTQMPSAPPSPSEVETNALQDAESSLIVDSYDIQVSMHQEVNNESIAQNQII
ncbi:hypothetical protein CEXT_489171 [Caerostris extrusa]|uniref:Uncharacterized protein n=1 Tax=Caerostris extrusa TaxID=172846 RepID=A0AAV4UM86_CAEEX|nr:hypothetical protein CEXT_489171 [Caerostris extrusa]